MPPARLVRVAAIVLLIAGFVLPCVPFADYAGYAMPAQDPTPAMLAQQAHDVTAAQHRLAVAAVVSAAFVLAGVAGLILTRKRTAGH